MMTYINITLIYNIRHGQNTVTMKIVAIILYPAFVKQQPAVRR